jgi:hypothetical protein
MKTILVCIVLCLAVSTTLFAQNDIVSPPKVLKDMFSNPQKRKPAIVKDKISSEGVRWIWGDYRYSYVGTSTKEKSVRIMVLGLQKDTTEVVRLCFGIHAADTKLKVEANSPVLIKFGDDTVYKTISLFSDEDNIGETHVLTYSTFSTYDIYVYIDLTDELLSGLSKGFKKIRFEINNDIYDVEPRKDNISKFIIDEHKLIKEAFNTKRSFDDDF